MVQCFRREARGDEVIRYENSVVEGPRCFLFLGTSRSSRISLASTTRTPRLFHESASSVVGLAIADDKELTLFKNLSGIYVLIIRHVLHSCATCSLVV